MMDYAQATLPQDSTGFASIQLEMGYLPHMSFDWDRPIGPRLYMRDCPMKKLSSMSSTWSKHGRLPMKLSRKPNSQWKSKQTSTGVSLTLMLETLFGSPQRTGRLNDQAISWTTRWQDHTRSLRKLAIHTGSIYCG